MSSNLNLTGSLCTLRKETQLIKSNNFISAEISSKMTTNMKIFCLSKKTYIFSVWYIYLVVNAEKNYLFAFIS